MKVLVKVVGDVHYPDKTFEVDAKYALEMIKANPYCSIVTNELVEKKIKKKVNDNREVE